MIHTTGGMSTKRVPRKLSRINRHVLLACLCERLDLGQYYSQVMRLDNILMCECGQAWHRALGIQQRFQLRYAVYPLTDDPTRNLRPSRGCGISCHFNTVYLTRELLVEDVAILGGHDRLHRSSKHLKKK